MNKKAIEAFLANSGFISNRAKYDRREKSELILPDVFYSGNKNGDFLVLDGRAIIDIAPSESEVIFFDSLISLDDDGSLSISSEYKHDFFCPKTRPDNSEYQERIDGVLMDTVDHFRLIKRSLRQYLIHSVDEVPNKIYIVPANYTFDMGILPEFKKAELNFEGKAVTRKNVKAAYKSGKNKGLN